jgi:hypothetical protein
MAIKIQNKTNPQIRFHAIELILKIPSKFKPRKGIGADLLGRYLVSFPGVQIIGGEEVQSSLN